MELISLSFQRGEGVLPTLQRKPKGHSPSTPAALSTAAFSLVIVTLRVIPGWAQSRGNFLPFST